MAGGGQVAIGHGADQIPSQAAVALELLQALGGSGLLEQGQLFTQPFELLGPLHPHAPHHPLHGAEQIHGHRHGGAAHVFKQQGRPSQAQHPIGDGRQLEIRIHRGTDAAQLTATLKELEETAQIAALLGHHAGQGLIPEDIHSDGWCPSRGAADSGPDLAPHFKMITKPAAVR